MDRRHRALLPPRERYFIEHRLRLLGLPSLRAYYATAHWKLTCRKWREASCERCGRKGKMSLHHKTYENLGRERRADLETLCVSCHRAVHGLPPVRRRRKGA